jgi:hypothetical protein
MCQLNNPDETFIGDAIKEMDINHWDLKKIDIALCAHSKQTYP